MTTPPRNANPALVSALLLVCACSGGAFDTGAAGSDSGAADTAQQECVDLGYSVTWDSYAAGFFTAYCNACHAADSPNRFGAPEGVSFDTLAQAVTWETRLRIRVIDEESMPLGGGVFVDDLDLFAVWMNCDMP